MEMICLLGNPGVKGLGLSVENGQLGPLRSTCMYGTTFRRRPTCRLSLPVRLSLFVGLWLWSVAHPRRPGDIIAELKTSCCLSHAATHLLVRTDCQSQCLVDRHAVRTLNTELHSDYCHHITPDGAALDHFNPSLLRYTIIFIHKTNLYVSLFLLSRTTLQQKHFVVRITRCGLTLYSCLKKS